MRRAGEGGRGCSVPCVWGSWGGGGGGMKKSRSWGAVVTCSVGSGVARDPRSRLENISVCWSFGGDVKSSEV